MASNFSFLQAEWPDLCEEAVRAERLGVADPRASCFYARRTLELTLAWLYEADDSLQMPYREDLAAMIAEPTVVRVAGPAIRAKMDVIRRQGNAAVHRKAPVTPHDALRTVTELFHVLYWVARTYSRDAVPSPSLSFDASLVPRPAPASVKLAKQAELKALAEKYAAQDAELAAERRRNQDLDAELAALRAQVRSAKEANEAQVDTHDYNESETRTLIIDLLLKEAGWTLDSVQDREYPVSGLPESVSKSGKGKVDYVLWDDDGKPLAVVEAKRTTRDARAGQHQAKVYADALEAQYGQRPVIFYTNGYHTYLWDDLAYPPREVQGFYTKDELRLLVQRRAGRGTLATLSIKDQIAGRAYQAHAIRRVSEAFENDASRHALLVMATGSGKTRTVIGLTDLMMRANWVKRVLFLADRKVLVRQAVNAFKQNLPGTPVVNLLEDKDPAGRVFVSTYPTLMNLINEVDDEGLRRFGPGYFDLIVVDEAHRSIYQKYGVIFDYFDALLVGLTATPKDELDRNTYRRFQLEDGVPTDSYSLNEAVGEGYLVPPKAVKVPLKFMEHGIRYEDLSDEEKAEWDEKEWSEDGERPDSVSRHEMNRILFNDDTVDKMLEVLVTQGHRVEGGDRLGKTIVFAKNNEHARFIEARYNANYPKGAGHQARVITYKETYRQSLIEDFSAARKEPDIAISVDMLDTGIDVPEVVNLVFAKPVFSKTKFWQMIGRGTRLRPALFGPDETNPDHAKQNFRVFDFCGNIDFFNSELAGVEARQAPALSERLLCLQLDLLRSLDRRQQPDPARDGGPDAIATEPSVRWALAHRLHATVAGMNLDNFLVRPHRREVETFADFRTWHRIDEDAEDAIREKLLCLPSDHETDPDETREEAKRFDLIAFRLQLAALDGGKEYAKLRQKVRDIADHLLGKANIPAVAEQLVLLEAVAGEEWWQDATLPMLEDLRRRLRGLAKLVDPKAKRKIVYTDFEDEFGEISEADIKDMPTGTDEHRFRQKARAYLLRHEDQPTVHKLRHNEQITSDDLVGLEEIFLAEAVASPEDLDGVRATGGLGLFVRTLCGLDRQAAQQAFEGFIAGKQLSAAQLDFVTLIIDVITKRGVLDLGDLYEIGSPFYDRAPGGPDDLFSPEQIDDLKIVFIGLRSSVQPPTMLAA